MFSRWAFREKSYQCTLVWRIFLWITCCCLSFLIWLRAGLWGIFNKIYITHKNKRFKDNFTEIVFFFGFVLWLCFSSWWRKRKVSDPAYQCCYIQLWLEILGKMNEAFRRKKCNCMQLFIARCPVKTTLILIDDESNKKVY